MSIPPVESGPDGKIPPLPGTNQIAGFVEFRPLTHCEKINNIYHCSCLRLRQKSNSMIFFFRHLSNSQSLVYSWQMSETASKIDEFMRYYFRQVDEVRYLKLS